jgi:hypothetical protein
MDKNVKECGVVGIAGLLSFRARMRDSEQR